MDSGEWDEDELQQISDAVDGGENSQSPVIPRSSSTPMPTSVAQSQSNQDSSVQITVSFNMMHGKLTYIQWVCS